MFHEPDRKWKNYYIEDEKSESLKIVLRGSLLKTTVVSIKLAFKHKQDEHTQKYDMHDAVNIKMKRQKLERLIDKLDKKK